MIDIGTVSAFLSSLGATIKFVQGSLEKIKDEAVREKIEELLNAIIPLQLTILSLQDAYITHIQEIEDLKKKLREIEDWRKEAEGYELKQLDLSSLVYVKKSESGHTGPVVYLCPKCFDIDHKKSILQVDTMGYHRCTNCKNRFPPYPH